MPVEAIRFIHDYPKPADKAALFRDCRHGKVAVLMGSTEKMGTGTNIQDRAVALHHMDVPWRPADLEQRALTNPSVTTEHDNTFIAYNTGHSDALYGQAVWVDDYVVMVLKSDNVSWRKFAPPRPGTGSYTSGMDRYPFCETCQDTFKRTTDTCQKCKDPRCPQGHCSCIQARERRCPKCSLTLNRSRFADFADPTTVCRDCE